MVVVTTKKQKSQQVRQIEQKKARAIDYAHTFATGAGERVLYDLMENHYMLQTSFNQSDSFKSAFQEGQRAVVIRILGMMKMDMKALNEQLDRALVHQQEMEGQNG